jgi:hypothetical protein
MHRFRWRTRSFMIFVAIVAVSMGVGVELRRRSQVFHRMAEYHSAASHQLADEGRYHFCGYGRSSEQIETYNARAKTADEKLALAASEYHESLRGKYESASRWPCLPIDPDPPPPPRSYPRLVTADDY